jgi:hypothetical protein
MADLRFAGLSDEELADIWYALSGAEIRHTDCFKQLADATVAELELRQGTQVRAFLDNRFANFRLVDALEDVNANQRSTTECDPPLDNAHPVL